MKSELIAELHIPKRSASRDLAFAIEHGVKTAEFVDDDAEIVAACDLSASFQRLIDDCERDLRTVNDAITLKDQLNARLDAGAVKVDELTQRAEALGEAVRSGR